MNELFAALYQFGDATTFLVLSAIGLAIIFGMMGVINLAHGEFIMCGAYVTVLSSRAGFPLPLAMFCGSLTAGMVGIILERLLIRHLYHRLFDSIVATWAISLIATQGMLIVAGPSIEGIKTPFGSFTLGEYSFSSYRVVLMIIAVLLLLGLYLLFMKTKYGVHARATIQNAEMARALGVNTGTVYSITFGLGAALAGLCGALYAPTTTTVPTMGWSLHRAVLRYRGCGRRQRTGRHRAGGCRAGWNSKLSRGGTRADHRTDRFADSGHSGRAFAAQRDQRILFEGRRCLAGCDCCKVPRRSAAARVSGAAF